MAGSGFYSLGNSHWFHLADNPVVKHAVSYYLDEEIDFCIIFRIGSIPTAIAFGALHEKLYRDSNENALSFRLLW